MRGLYNFLYWIYFVFSFPYYLLRGWGRGDWQRGFAQTFGHYDINLKQSITNRHLCWVQAPGLGDVRVCGELIHALEGRLPNVKFIVSTTRAETWSELRKRLPPKVGKIYHPLDRRDCVARALNAVHPRAIILIGGQVQPNFIWRARTRHFPVFLVNARLSRRLYLRYQRFGFLFRHVFESLTLIGAQTEEQASRFRAVGGATEAIQVLGDLAQNPAAIGRTVETILAHLSASDLYIAPVPAPRSSVSGDNTRS